MGCFDIMFGVHLSIRRPCDQLLTRGADLLWLKGVEVGLGRAKDLETCESARYFLRSWLDFESVLRDVASGWVAVSWHGFADIPAAFAETQGVIAPRLEHDWRCPGFLEVVLFC